MIRERDSAQAHYQTGLFALTLARSCARPGSRPRASPRTSPRYAPRGASRAPAADAAASHRAHPSSPPGDAAKNALLAAVSLHGALAAGRDLAARGLPFGNVDAPTDAELANVTLDARRRAQRFLEVHADDVDADVFRRFWLVLDGRPRVSCVLVCLRVQAAADFDFYPTWQAFRTQVPSTAS